MEKFIPNSYYKSIYDIDYDKLARDNIKCLIFDLDNTLALIDEGIPPESVINFMKNLSKRFDTYILSNNNKKRIDKYCRYFETPFVSFAMKPLKKGFKAIKNKKNYDKSEMCMIGDQLVTDILGGNRFGCYTILVDPLGEKDLKVTTINRAIEKKMLKKFSKEGKLERGKYYE